MSGEVEILSLLTVPSSAYRLEACASASAAGQQRERVIFAGRIIAILCEAESGRVHSQIQFRPRSFTLIPDRETNMRRAPTAEDLGIHLSSKDEGELFKWFLACLLFGKPIQRQVAERAFLTLASARLLSPDAILRAGWDELVRLLDEAHYVRYDFSTATKLLHVSKELKERYGMLTTLVAQCRTPAELSTRLQELKYIGPVTAQIFLREVRPIWYRPVSGKEKQHASACSAQSALKLNTTILDSVRWA